MTPEARLAAALHAQQHPNADRKDPCYLCVRDAKGILAADPTLADDLALAAAVRRLHPGDAMTITYDDSRWHIDGYTHDLRHVEAYAPTLLAAIEEALR